MERMQVGNQHADATVGRADEGQLGTSRCINRGHIAVSMYEHKQLTHTMYHSLFDTIL